MNSGVSVATCQHCGKGIQQKYAGTFWKHPDPMPMTWVHTVSGLAVCSWAEPKAQERFIRDAT